MERADLHMHTTASDGVVEPADLVRLVSAQGIAAIAVTDHDVTDGVFEAMNEGKSRGIEVLAGVEINTDLGDTEVHVLGYLMDIQDVGFQATMEWLREGRVQRARKMVQRLNELGCPITWERVQEISGYGAIGRPHVAQAMVEAGCVSTRGEAFERYLAREAPAYVPRARFSAEDAIKSIREAGGIAIAAHPVQIRDDSLIPALVEAGLGGLEAYHPSQEPEVAEHYRKMAGDMGLVWTGGSDFHGNNEARPLGGSTIPYSQVEALKAAAHG
jgi:3',5'-nucleoside bisphosphate phosphatase